MLAEAGRFASERAGAAEPRRRPRRRARSRTARSTTAPGWREVIADWCAAAGAASPRRNRSAGRVCRSRFPRRRRRCGTPPACPSRSARCSTMGAVEALERHAHRRAEGALSAAASSPANGPRTMNLTEPQAGSDLGALTTRAERRADGTYRLFGQKIFITYGEHDLAENIVHLVLARLPDAPAGSTRDLALPRPEIPARRRRQARRAQRRLLRPASSTSSASTARRPAR